MSDLEITLRADAHGRLHLDTKGFSLSGDQVDQVISELREAVETRLRQVKAGSYTFQTSLPRGINRQPFTYETTPNPEFRRFGIITFKASEPEKVAVWRPSRTLQAVVEKPPPSKVRSPSPKATPTKVKADRQTNLLVNTVIIGTILLVWALLSGL